MRIVTGAAKPTSCESLRFWLGIVSVEEWHKLAAAQAYMKAITTVSHPLNQWLRAREEEQVQQRLRTIRSWVLGARESVEESTSIENIQENPWTPSDNLEWDLGRIGNRTWRESDERVNTMEVL